MDLFINPVIRTYGHIWLLLLQPGTPSHLLCGGFQPSAGNKMCFKPGGCGQDLPQGWRSW